MSPNRGLLRSFFCVLCAVGFSGCFSAAEESDDSSGCETDLDCREGRVCEDGDCVDDGLSGTGGTAGTIGTTGGTAGTIGTTGGTGTGGSGAVTCSSTAVFSCTYPAASDFYSCHEFYNSAAADAIRDDCVSLGLTVSEAPCASQFSVCCLSIAGSNGYPENACVWAADAATYQTWRDLCIADGDLVCG